MKHIAWTFNASPAEMFGTPPAGAGDTIIFGTIIFMLPNSVLQG